jgi:hypothetical protein
MATPAAPVRIGDVVLYHRPTGDTRFPDPARHVVICPAIVTRVYEDGRVALVVFDPRLGGVGVATVNEPVKRGTRPGEWEPRATGLKV